MEKRITPRSSKITYQQTELDLELKRVLFEFSNSLVSVKFNSRYPGFEFLGIKIPAVLEGSRIEIPVFIAEKLLKENLIEDFSDSFPVSLQDLTTAVRKEVRQGEVQSVYPFLYSLFKHQNLKNSSETSHYNEIELKRQKDRMKQLIKERLAKIIKFADSDRIKLSKLNLTASEQILMQKVLSIVDNWKKMIIQDEPEGTK
ncbi:MAG: hypothetical protein ACXAB2_04535 [Candidatus Hodarchaeales archaeon]